jgi:hypothetical protein
MAEMKRAIAREEQERRNQDRFASTIVIAAAIFPQAAVLRNLRSTLIDTLILVSAAPRAQ